VTQDEFLFAIRWTMPQYASWCKSHSFNEVMNLKREMQQALSTYAKKHKYDAVQAKALAILSKLEKWCKYAFVEMESARIIRGSPSLATSPTTVKTMARQQWEILNSRMSY